MRNCEGTEQLLSFRIVNTDETVRIEVMMEQKEQREKIYLSSPTMHGEEQKFVAEAFDTNWVAPLGQIGRASCRERV